MKADPKQLVAALGAQRGSERFASYEALVRLGSSALPALREGLGSDEWQVRRWSAICLDRLADAEALRDLIPLLRDPHPKVRLWAVHSLACDHCRVEMTCPEDVVPHLIERVRSDPSIRVRRMAVIMLGSDTADPRAIPVLEWVLATDTDAKLLGHARRALDALTADG